jgi:SAM-dependent methyltransferase
MVEATLSLEDVEGVRDYLGSFDLFAGIEAEGQSYISLALHRFLITVSLVPPAGQPGARLLELGANPYFITLLLKRFTSYELVLANYFGETAAPGERGKQTVTSRQYGEQHVFEYDQFNGERDSFPYPDGTFDLVLNCEILEHLPLDPTHYLCECHRVLKSGGAMLLTTPNVLALQNLWRLAASHNIFDLYSGYGVYGRHNREYTPSELVNLLQGCGFSVEQVKLEDIYAHHGLTRQLKRFRRHWRDNLFVLARAHGRPIYYYPPWLYRSMASLRRVVRPDIVMGENDAIQLGRGWHPLERLPYAARWTSEHAYAYLLRPENSARLGLEVSAPGAPPAPMTLTVKIGSVDQSFALKAGVWEELYVPVPSALPSEVEVGLTVNPTYNPCLVGHSQDNRELGVLVKRIWLESAA